MKKNKSGFTLIELLVVISIIGLLSSMAIYAINAARVKAKNAKRLGDMKQIQTAIELYFDNYGYYPTCGSTVCSSNGYAGDIKNLEIKPTYMASIPVDPVNTSTQYGYYYARGYKKAGAISYVNTSQSTDYIMATRLENSSLPAFSAWNNSYLNHLLGN